MDSLEIATLVVVSVILLSLWFLIFCLWREQKKVHHFVNRSVQLFAM